MQPNSIGFKNIDSAITLFGDGINVFKELSLRGVVLMVGELLFKVGSYFQSWELVSKLGVTLNVGSYSQCWELVSMLGVSLNVGS